MKRPISSPLLGVAAALLGMLASGCAPNAAATVPLSTAALPGSPILAFPNSGDRIGTTVIGSKPGVQQAGVGGRVLAVSSYRDRAETDDLTVDIDGNMGLRGTYHSLSSRRFKTDIAPFALDALRLVDDTNVMQYRFRTEARRAPLHVGVIAEDVPAPFTGPGRDSIDLNNSLAIALAATKELHAEVRALEGEVGALKRRLNQERRPAATHARTAPD